MIRKYKHTESLNTSGLLNKLSTRVCHLPHQSQSLPPLIPRLMRTQSTSASGGEQQPAEQPTSKVSGSISSQQNVAIQFGPPGGWWVGEEGGSFR